MHWGYNSDLEKLHVMRSPVAVAHLAKQMLLHPSRASGGTGSGAFVRSARVVVVMTMWLGVGVMQAQESQTWRPTIGLSHRQNLFRTGALTFLPKTWYPWAVRPDSAVVRLSATRHNIDPACATAFFVDESGLLLTTYQAIRGAEQLELSPRGGQPVIDQVGVASYSVEQDLAVLHVNRDTWPTLSLGGGVSIGDVVTRLGYGDGLTPVSSPVTIRGWPNAPTGSLRFTGRPLSCGLGGPVLNQAGMVVGVVEGETTAIPIQRAVPFVEQARENVIAGRVLSVRGVAEREKHLYGSVLFLSETSTLSARVTPLETWQWISPQGGTTPFSFSGPMGRYEVSVLLDGIVDNTTVVEVRPTVTIRFSLVVGAPGRRGGISLPAILLVTGLAGGGVGAAALLSPGGGEVVAPSPQTGGITIAWRDPNR